MSNAASLTLDNDTQEELPAFLSNANRDNLTPLPKIMTNQAAIAASILPDSAVTTTFRTAAATQGSVDSSVSKQWASRPDDEKFLDLYTMRTAIENRFKQCRTIETRADDININNQMQLEIAGYDNVANLNNWTFNQLCNLANVPVEYIKRIANDDNLSLVADNIRHGVSKRKDSGIKALINIDTKELRALNSATYGRIWDYQVIDQVIKVAGNGINETQWKVPGQINWQSSNGVTVEYNPFVDVTKETTTLYASDRDCYIFLVDDTHPIEVGKLSNGEPDLMFRGFYVWNSEVGADTFGISTMLMRGVCQNRNIWGVEGKTQLQFRHSVKAPDKFVQHAFPMLAAYSMSPTIGIVSKVRNAKATIIARDDEERNSFLLSKVKLPQGIVDSVLAKCIQEEQKPMESVWDAVQGMTAVARGLRHQDARLALESKAGALMERIAA